MAVLAAPVPAGFPSPAEDYVEGKLDLNEHLIRRPAATFIVRVEGDSMIEAGIFSGDLLVVDRGIEARPDSIVVAAVGGELVVKRLRKKGAGWVLEAENPDFPAIEIGADCAIWGVVTSSIRRFDRR
ncbi:MAG: translesion error-prone DNA polymerase V autoproteolytic subunit [Proteobacteria bacterium]|nr:translesion error-prone DNA polymerase V autoproteolytic subunit [Pseudomonadota bacterium]